MEQLSYKLPDFEGPLDLLLHLIAKNKLQISEVRISSLLDQYLEQIEQMQAADLDVASEFLEMASRLVYIKTVYLLPKHEEAEALEKELVGQLLEYQICKEMAGEFGKLLSLDRFIREPGIRPGRVGVGISRCRRERQAVRSAAYGENFRSGIQTCGIGNLSNYFRITATASGGTTPLCGVVYRKVGKNRDGRHFFGSAGIGKRRTHYGGGYRQRQYGGTAATGGTGMTEQEQLGAVEAILFASGDPVSPDKIADALEISVRKAEALLETVSKQYAEDARGIHVVKLDGEYQMCSNKDFAPQVRRVLELRRNAPLSSAAMEVLAVVAYNQPVTKSFLEQVRGVDCSGVVGSLMTKGLIEERGRLELPGRPLLYGTTQNFLRCMGISSLEELPPLPNSEEASEEAPPEQLKLTDVNE